MNTKLFYLLILSVVIKLLLSLSTFHYDLQHFALSGFLMNQGHILDLYDAVSQLPVDNPLVKTNPTYPFNYPPLIYLYHGLFSFIFSPLINHDIMVKFIIDPIKSLGGTQVNFYLLLLKLPYLLFDLLGWYLITKIVAEKHRFTISLLYLFNPINLYASYMIGQFDIIPTVFTLLSLYYYQKNKLSLSAISLGLGALFKIYPLFFLPVLAFSQGRFTGKIKLLAIGLLPYIIGNLFYLPSHGYRTSALIANQSLKSLYASIPISGGEAIILFPAILIFFYLVFYFKSKLDNVYALIRCYFCVLLLFFIFTHTHPQWFLWLTPFLIIDLAVNRFKNLILVVGLILSWLGLVLFFDPSLSMRLFAPLYPSWSNLPDIWTSFNLHPDYNFCRSLLQTIFTGIAGYYIYLNLPRQIKNSLDE